jgi:hypothetical protein
LGEHSAAFHLRGQFWAQVFLYRCLVLLSISTDVFKVHDFVEAARTALGGKATFPLAPIALNEPLCDCLLLCSASTDLRAQPAPWVYGRDASKSRAAILRIPVSESVSHELWRFSELADWHAFLLSPIRELLSPIREYFRGFEQRSHGALVARGLLADSLIPVRFLFAGAWIRPCPFRKSLRIAPRFFVATAIGRKV